MYQRRRGARNNRTYPRRRRAPRNQYGYFGKAGSDAQKALQMAGKALSLINVEHHSYDNSVTIATQTTTATVQNVLATAQGDGVADRQGNSIKVTKVQGRFTVYHNTSSTQPGTTTRILVLVDHQANGALPAAADIITTSTDPQSFRNVNFGKRFTVLMDKTITTDTYNRIVACEFYKDVEFHVEFKGSTSGITHISTNSIVLLAVTDEATNGPQINRFLRVRWIDN